jgi:hypothetical protein
VLLRVGYAQRGVADLTTQGRIHALLLVAGAATMLGAAGCRVAAPAFDDVTWALHPARPVVGPATLRVTIGEPHAAASGTTVRVVGHMAHPGMVPVVGTVTPRGHGVYDAKMNLTMPGDWVFVVTVHLADGRRFERNIPVPNVEAPRP